MQKSCILISGEGLLLQEDSESVTETMDTSWEGDLDASRWTTSRAMQSEREIRYFVDLTRRAMCIEWNVLLGILLQDQQVFGDTLEQLKEIAPQVILPDDIGAWLLEGVASLSQWATKNK